MPRRRVIALSLNALVLCAVAFGADAPAADAPAAAKPAAEAESGLQRDALVIEISTAGYYELAARARELGLSDAGAAEELRARLYQHYGLQAPAAAAKGRVVTIERAGQATYAKVEDEEGGIVRASGGVILTLVETNGDSHRIQADSLAYDRARATMTARGSVTYERKSGSSTEVFKGEALSADLDDWSGVFIDGKVRRSGGSAAAGERGLVVTADTILRRSSDVMVLKDGVISSCDADDPHYAVRAGRVWLLGEKEWAISDAVFSLGNVPILWLPFFYYPGQEIVFHPVIGYRSREGRFVQTTVYLLGAKPPKKDTTSILSFQDTGTPTAKPTQLKGIFLRRIAGTAPKDEGSIKTMADLYSGLGGFAGIQGSLPKLAFLDKTDFFAGIGLSRSLFSVSGGYSPYVDAGNDASVWNRSDFLGLSLPFRYGLDFSTSLRKGSFSASLALPAYSDPYFDSDFRYRSEDMDWLKILSSTDSAATTATATTQPATRTQLLPKFDASFSWKPKAIDPWVSSIDITKFSTNMTLSSKADTTVDGYTASSDKTLYNVDPRRQFFYPYGFQPFNVSASIRGTLFGPKAAAAPAAAPAKPSAEASPAALRSPWAAETDDGGANPAAEAGDGAAPAAADDFRLPPKAPSPTAAKAPAWSGSATWSLSPSAYYEDRYRADLTDPSKIGDSLDSPLYELLNYRLAASLDASAQYGELLSSSLGFTYSDQDQTRKDNDPNFDYTQTDNLFKSRRLGGKASLSTRPFASSWLWSGTSLSWGMDTSIYGLKYDSSAKPAAAFKETWISWDPSSITSHNVSLNLAARPNGLTQKIAVTASLPPLLDSYSGSVGLDAGLASFSLQSRVYRKALGDSSFSFDPITARLALGRSPGPVLSDSFVYDAYGISGASPVGPVSNSTTLSWGPFNASFGAKRTRSYMLVQDTGWVAYGSEAFGASDFSLSLAPQLKSPASASKATWSFLPTLSLSQSLVRFSESSLSFGLTAAVKLGDEFSLSLSSQSQNSAVWKYYAGLFSSTPIVLSSTQTVSPSAYGANPLTDIWDSLQVWDTETLRSSYFKLKSLSFKAARDLHDWTMSVEASTAPRYDQQKKSYSLETSFSFLLAWKDIPDIKTTVKKSSTKDSAGNKLSY